ncbi:Uncharacterised protein [Mycobacteroides abscessus subsp. abscessus]|nr:Uncharacterised protein [Mycobacteroides abscessus subsp. abscessus]
MITVIQLRHAAVGMGVQRTTVSPPRSVTTGATEPAATNRRTPSSIIRYQRTSPATGVERDASSAATADDVPSVIAATNSRRPVAAIIPMSRRKRLPANSCASSSGSSASVSSQMAMPIPGRQSVCQPGACGALRRVAVMDIQIQHDAHAWSRRARVVEKAGCTRRRGFSGRSEYPSGMADMVRD